MTQTKKKKSKCTRDECGTKQKCYDCVLGMFLAYLEVCSALYTKKISEEELSSIAQKFIDKCTTKELGDIGDFWVVMLEYIHEFPARERAGVRRGFDLLTVASMSRYQGDYEQRR